METVDLLQKNAYGDYSVSQLRPIISGDAIYGFIPANFRTFTAGSGSATTNDCCFKTISGTGLGDYGVVRSFRSINYKTGQGVVLRFSGWFSSPKTGTWSAMGAFNIGDECSFGYNGVNFGCWHRYNGKPEIRSLQITGGAGGSENATVTINSVQYTIALTTGSVQSVARQITDYLNSTATLFVAEQLNDKVVIEFLTDGSKNGTYSMSSDSATGTFSQVLAGVTKTSDHYPMTEMDFRKLSSFDPTKGNNYQIKYFGGFGDISYQIQDSTSGNFIEVFKTSTANKKIIPNFGNPSLHLGCYSTNVGGSSSVEVHMFDISGFSDLDSVRTRNPRGYSSTKSISTTNTNILTIRNTRIYNGRNNQVEFEPDFLSLSNEGNKTAIFELRTNATVGGSPNFQEVGNNLITHYDVSGTTVSGGTLLATFTVSPNSSKDISLTILDIRIPPSLKLTVSGKLISGTSADLSATLVWYEDI